MVVDCEEAAPPAVPVPRPALKALLAASAKLLTSIVKQTNQAVMKAKPPRRTVTTRFAQAPKALPGKTAAKLSAKKAPTAKAMPKRLGERAAPPSEVVDRGARTSTEDLPKTDEVAKKRRAEDSLEKRKANLSKEHDKQRKDLLAKHADELIKFSQKCKLEMDMLRA